jgi:S-formylglutathione hydrolase FrmB
MTVLLIAVGLVGGCKREPRQQAVAPVTVPAGAVLTDRTFRSEALGRSVTYRVISPAAFPAGRPVRVVYLLHGNGQTYQEWSRWSHVADLAAQGDVLVMPEGGSGYFMNSAGQPRDRYEDFVTRDLIADVEQGLPSPVTRAQRSIVGDSMGGFAALVLGMKHPELYGFVGALSPPVDAAERKFTVRRLGQSLGFRTIFGADGSATRAADDPFVVARKVDPAAMPYIFLSVGRQEPLLEPVVRFDAVLTRRKIAHEFHLLPGGHNWTQWNAQMPGLVYALSSRT